MSFPQGQVFSSLVYPSECVQLCLSDLKCDSEFRGDTKNKRGCVGSTDQVPRPARPLPVGPGECGIAFEPP